MPAAALASFLSADAAAPENFLLLLGAERALTACTAEMLPSDGERRVWASVRGLQGRQLVVESLLVPAAAQCSTSANLKGAIWSRVEGRELQRGEDTSEVPQSKVQPHGIHEYI